MTNQQLYDKALKAIEELYSDLSVSKEQAIKNLSAIKDEIDIMLDGLRIQED